VFLDAEEADRRKQEIADLKRELHELRRYRDDVLRHLRMSESIRVKQDAEIARLRRMFRG